jgi:peptidoglycan/LPS O-acetylase OafA/YrhL
VRASYPTNLTGNLVLAIKIDEAIRASTASLLYMRLLAAIAVLHSHSFAIVSGQRDSQPIVPIIDVTVGTFAVHIFFAISGYLICGSAFKGKFFEFLIARCLRIFPALILLLCVTCFIIGPFASESNASRYFSDPVTWKYFGKNGSMIFGARFDLPGVFVSNPLTAMVNGSLWTLPYELRLYFVFSILCILGSRLSGQATKYLFTVSILTIILITYTSTSTRSPGSILRNFAEFVPPDLLYIFLLGSLTRVFARNIAIRPTYFFALFAGLCILFLYIKGAVLPFYYACLPYLLVSIAYFFSRFAKSIPNDYSYSTYLWAFPIQQCLVLLMPRIGVVELSLVSVLIVGLLAHLTWVYVENPMIGLSKRLQSRVSLRSVSQVAV